MHISFTGPRTLTKKQEKDIYKDFSYFIANHAATWHVGDAAGLDNFVRRAAPYYKKELIVYEVEGNQRWQYAKRSKRMIDAIADMPNSWLYAFPNKKCPDKCKPEKNVSGDGSGTWLTIAYARYKGLNIKLFPQFEVETGDHSWTPDWLVEESPKQLSLF
ncbi:hypothetical protein NIES4075_67930 [Tolypothrix sp. NIES-4075]|uniref:hypothetical protein n=1 Tax=Tolypothrix sp. NIES-4075 TaxID=2005459 RepID=UPI000B5C8CF9|nr:hypothetical protein [Tolypothrix sp. NIES-4075]GAX45772.1 hypothetical protein NIES4075_67930 [Tolypothrix sp. NIES-4075]